jgi:hypothetical protein
VSGQLLSRAPLVDDEFGGIAETKASDPVFTTACIDEPLADVIGQGIAHEFTWRTARDTAEAVANRLDGTGAAKHVAEIEHVTPMSEVAEMVCRAQEDRTLTIVGCVGRAVRNEFDDMKIERVEHARDIGPRRIRGRDLLKLVADRFDRVEIYVEDDVRRVEADPTSGAHAREHTRERDRT